MLTNDKKVEGHKPLLHFPPSKHLKFQLWRRFVVVEKQIAEADFVALYPRTADKVAWWRRYTDENGGNKVVRSQEERDAKREKHRLKRQAWRKRKAEQTKYERQAKEAAERYKKKDAAAKAGKKK